MNINDYSDIQLIEFNLKAALTGTLPSDKPLLEELGIDFATIKRESQIIFLKSVSDPRDLSGPLLFMILFCVLLLLRAIVFCEQLVFGYIYFNAIFMCLFVYAIVNLLCGDEGSESSFVERGVSGSAPRGAYRRAASANSRHNGTLNNDLDINPSNAINSDIAFTLRSNKSIDLLAVTSIIGYSFMPILFLQAILFCIKMINFYVYKGIKIPMSLAFVFWSSYCATNNFYFLLDLRDKFYLIFYPLFLCYAVFAMIGAY